MAAMGCFGIALVGLHFIFVSTNTPTSLSACAMYIVGTVVGVIAVSGVVARGWLLAFGTARQPWGYANVLVNSHTRGNLHRLEINGYLPAEF
jgi:hypothetical protein